MKKKLAFLALLTIPAFTLTACSDLLDMFYFGGSFFPQGGYQSISTPPPGDTEPHYAPTEYTYASYISNNCYHLSATPAIGTAKLLVIPVWFSDSTNYITISKREDVRSDIRATYFGANEETGWRSVKTYYEEESHGKLTINGTVAPWYECGKDTLYYAVDGNEQTGVEKTTGLLNNALNWYFTNNPSEDKKDYDCDGDGYLDGIMLIYAAPDFQAIKRDLYSNLWAYCYWIQDPHVKSVSNPGANAFFWASYDFMYGSVRAKARTGMTYSNGDTSHALIDAHTYIHEMGHMFGLVDYYDYTKRYDPCGGFSMQDNNVGGHDPFSSFALGWGKAYVPTETTVIDLKPFSTSGEVIILKPNAESYNYSPFDEYIMLEYFTPTGLNEFDCTYKYMSSEGKDYSMGSQSPGIRVWHVDGRLLYPKNLSGGHYVFEESKVTTNPSFANTYGVTLMMSNTYYKDGSESSYLSPLGRDYSDYNLLQLIRSSTTYTNKVPAKSGNSFSSASLFKYGNNFSMEKYQGQFVHYSNEGGHNVGLLNTKSDLGFSFEINGCTEEFASITITKL